MKSLFDRRRRICQTQAGVRCREREGRKGESIPNLVAFVGEDRDDGLHHSNETGGGFLVVVAGDPKGPLARKNDGVDNSRLRRRVNPA